MDARTETENARLCGGSDCEPRLWYHDRTALAVAAVAFLLGIAAALGCRHQTPSDLIYDAKVYDELARKLLSEHRYRTTYWPPGFTVFVAVVYAVSGCKIWSVFAVQALLFAASVILVYQTARIITQSRGIALGTCAAWAAWPIAYEMICRLLPSVLSAFLICLSVYLLVVNLYRPGIRNAFLAGLVCGASAVTVAATLPFSLLSAFLLRGSQDARRSGRPVLWFLLGLLCLTLPWTMYASYKARAPVIGSTGGGFNFYLGNCPPWDHRPWRGEYPPEIARKVQGASDVERDRILLKEALTCIVRHPGRALVRFGQKFSHLWLGELGLAEAVKTPPGRFDAVRRPIVRVPLFLLAAAGIMLLPAEWRKRAAPVLLLLVTVTAVYVLVTAEARYSFPMIPYAMLFAIVALVRLADRLRALFS